MGKSRNWGKVTAVLLLCLTLGGCGEKQQLSEKEQTNTADTSMMEMAETIVRDSEEPDSEKTDSELQQEVSLIVPEGTTLETRILTPEGYCPVEAAEGSLAEFLRTYPVKEDGSPVLLYNGQEKGNQNAHAAVLSLPIETEDLQQCADSVMRVFAEYFWSIGAYDRISFHFVSGFLAEYAKWRDGYRIQVSGNQVNWVKTAEPDDSYESFLQYLRIVFAYAGTLSMESESTSVELADLQAGDVFLRGGSPGHVVMVINVCENAEGKKAFLLGQGYMPAQEFHVLKNPAHENDPWYYEEEVAYPFVTPEYVFEEGSLRRLSY